MQLSAVTDGSFAREVLRPTVPVLVKFFASGPTAHTADKILEQIAQNFRGRLRVVSVDVGRNPTVTGDYDIRGVPALVMFQAGKPVARRIVGHASRDDLEAWVRTALMEILAHRSACATRSGVSFKLSNGLTGVVIPDHRAPIVTHTLWYRVGAADEPQGLSGLAGLVAHLSFVSLEKTTYGGFARSISRIGGERNGTGDRNATMYYERVGKEHLWTVMEIEADRMAQLSVTDADLVVEREVFMEQQRTARENSPADALIEEVKSAHYRGHRHSIPALGSLEETSKIKLEDVLGFHKRYYTPNNAVLVVCGDVSPDDVVQLAKATYGKVPAAPRGGSQRSTVPVHIPEYRVVVQNTRTDTVEFRRRYSVPGYGAAKPGEAEALEVLGKVLGGMGPCGLYPRLAVEDDVASAVTAGYLGYAGDLSGIWIHAIATSSDVSSLETSVDVVLAEIRKHGVNQDELDTAKAGLIADHIYESSDQLKLAMRYGNALAVGLTIPEIESWPAAISKVTAADVKSVASTYLIDRRAVTGWLIPDQRTLRARDARASVLIMISGKWATPRLQA